MRKYTSIDPASGKVQKTYSFLEDVTLASTTERVSLFSKAWKKSSFDERRKCLRKIRERLAVSKQSFAELITSEMGKPIKQSLSEVEKCLTVLDHYADKGESYLEPIPIRTESKESYVLHSPVGVVLAVMPWNFPLWQLFRFMAPAVMAGNCILMKHAENVPTLALEVEKLVSDSGAPKGLLTNIFATHDQIAQLIEDDRVGGVTFTGSSRVGQIIAEKASRFHKKYVLELGGSDPYIVCEDADLALAVDKIVTSRLINSGQSCIAAKRVIVEEPVYEKFKALLIDAVSNIACSHPSSPECRLGPLARKDLYDALKHIVDQSIEKGAKLLFEGKKEDSLQDEKGGWFYPVQILENVLPHHEAFMEETFGPVFPLIKARNFSEAVELANASAYRLGAAIFTRDEDSAKKLLLSDLDFGSIAINDFVRSDARLPFGGYKASGSGKELGRDGILEFVYRKTIVVGA